VVTHPPNSGSVTWRARTSYSLCGCVRGKSPPASLVTAAAGRMSNWEQGGWDGLFRLIPVAVATLKEVTPLAVVATRARAGPETDDG